MTLISDSPSTLKKFNSSESGQFDSFLKMSRDFFSKTESIQRRSREDTKNPKFVLKKKGKRKSQHNNNK